MLLNKIRQGGRGGKNSKTLKLKTFHNEVHKTDYLGTFTYCFTHSSWKKILTDRTSIQNTDHFTGGGGLWIVARLPTWHTSEEEDFQASDKFVCENLQLFMIYLQQIICDNLELDQFVSIIAITWTGLDHDLVQASS